VSIREAASVDGGLLAALDAAHAAGSVMVERLRTALPFVELANTDDEFMTEHAEAILMGSAFEQLLTGDASAYRLGAKFGELFGQFGRCHGRGGQKGSARNRDRRKYTGAGGGAAKVVGTPEVDRRTVRRP
jgi:hypothetical protein